MKVIFKSILILFFIALIFLSYLSIVGIETDRFNNQISNKIKNINKEIEIELKKINLILDPFKLKLNFGASPQPNTAPPCVAKSVSALRPRFRSWSRYVRTASSSTCPWHRHWNLRLQSRPCVLRWSKVRRGLPKTRFRAMS